MLGEIVAASGRRLLVQTGGLLDYRWQGLIERHLENGVLELLAADYVSFDRGIYAILTACKRESWLGGAVPGSCLRAVRRIGDDKESERE